MDLIQDLWIEVQALDTGWIYLIIFLSGYLENLIPPVPGDMVTVFAASLVGVGRLNYFATFTTAAAGNICGFMTMYAIGRWLGREFFEKRELKYFPKAGFQKTEQWFSKYGYFVITFNRFLSGLRSVISIFAGMTGLNPLKVMGLAFVSACLWDGALIYAGYLLGDNWKLFESMLQKYNQSVFAILALGFVIFIILKVYSKYRRPSSGE